MALSRVSKQEAQTLLLENGSDGSFILRESATEPGLVILAVKISEKVEQFIIKPDPNGPFKLGKFIGSLTDIIEHHKQYPLHGALLTEPLPLRLMKPRPESPSAASTLTRQQQTPPPQADPEPARSFVVNDVSRRPLWFHGLLTKEQAEQLLLEDGKTGSFLIRVSPRHPDQYALALRREENDVKHLKISCENGMFSLGDNHGPFLSLADLVETYRTSASLWATKLVDPIPLQAVLNVAVSQLKQGSLLNTILPKGQMHARFYSVDEHGYFLLWRISASERRWLPFRNMVEIRRGTNTKMFLQHRNILNAPLTFSILYRDGTADIQSLDLIASTSEEYENWLTGLDYLLQKSRKLDDPADWKEFLLTEWLDLGLKPEELDRDVIPYRDIEAFVKRLHAVVASSETRQLIVQALGSQAQTIAIDESSSKFNFTIFTRVFSALKARRRDLAHLFSHGPTISLSEFRRFLSDQLRPSSPGSNEPSSGSASRRSSFSTSSSSTTSLSALSANALVTEQEAVELIAKYEISPNNVSQRIISRRAFFRFLLSKDNDLFDQAHLFVYQDMSRPLSHYFISTSHNTQVILDNSATPEVAIDGYMRLLLSGVRCLHLEVYDGPTPDSEPIVSSKIVLAAGGLSYPGASSSKGKSGASLSAAAAAAAAAATGRLSSQYSSPYAYSDEWNNLSGGGGGDKKGKPTYVSVPLSQVLKVVLTHGFVASPYPVILLIINRCSQPFQRKMASLLQSVLGDSVLATPLSESVTGAIPSPSQLKGRVIIMASKQATDHDWFDDDYDFGAQSTSGHCVVSPSAGGNSAAGGLSGNAGDVDPSRARVDPAFASLVFLELSRFQSVSRQRRIGVFEVPAIDEQKLLDICVSDSSCSELKELTQKTVVHCRPSTKRPPNSNPDPIPIWNGGVQLIGLNHLSRGLAVKFHQAKFKVNGGCGYVLKPPMLTSLHARPTGNHAGVKIIVRVLSAQQLRRIPGPRLENSGNRKTSDPNDKPIAPFVVAETCGALKDCIKYQTPTIAENGFDPEWTDQNEFVFSIGVAETTFLRFAVYDALSKQLLGQSMYPVTSINEGYRHVRLYDEDNELIDQSTVFVHISLRELSTLGGRMELSLDDLIAKNVVPFNSSKPNNPSIFLGPAGSELLAQQYGVNDKLMRLLKALETMIERQQKSRTLIDEINEKLARFDAQYLNSTDVMQYRFTYHKLPSGAHDFRLCNVYEYFPAQDTYTWKAYFFLY